MKENNIEDRINNAYCFLNSMHSDFRTGLYYKEDLENLEHILSDYKRVLKENEEKNKIIDSMTKVMIDSSICDYFIKENCKNYAGENRKICDDCIKEYFENKVKEVK